MSASHSTNRAKGSPHRYGNAAKQAAADAKATQMAANNSRTRSRADPRTRSTHCARGTSITNRKAIGRMLPLKPIQSPSPA